MRISVAKLDFLRKNIYSKYVILSHIHTMTPANPDTRSDHLLRTGREYIDIQGRLGVSQEQSLMHLVVRVSDLVDTILTLIDTTSRQSSDGVMDICQLSQSQIDSIDFDEIKGAIIANLASICIDYGEDPDAMFDGAIATVFPTALREQAEGLMNTSGERVSGQITVALGKFVDACHRYQGVFSVSTVSKEIVIERLHDLCRLLVFFGDMHETRLVHGYATHAIETLHKNEAQLLSATKG